MAQQLRTLIAFPKDPGSNPSTHFTANNVCNSKIDMFTQTYLQAKKKKPKNNAHKIKVNKFFKKHKKNFLK